MERRTVVVGAAFGVAALVLCASIFLGPPAGTEETTEMDGESVGAAMPNKRPGDDTGNVGFTAPNGEYQTIEDVGDNKIRITLLGADNFSTPSQGITHLRRPRFQIVTTEYGNVITGTDAQGHPITHRVAIGGQAMLLSADTAQMEIDGTEPQRGVFQGNVVVTLLKAEGRAIVLDPNDPRFDENTDITRIFIDGDARFGLDTNDVRSTAPVHVTSAQADFYGIGLLLKYNTARERIEQLVIREGRYLMFNPEANKSTNTRPNQTNQAQQGSVATGETTSEADANPITGEAPTEQDEAIGPSQYYLVTFYNDIIVRDTDRALLEGDELNIRFSLGKEAVEPEPIVPVDEASSAAPLAPAIAGMRLATNGNALPPLPAPFNPALIPALNRQRSLYTIAPHEGIVITWTGALHLVPLSEKPAELADDSDIAIAIEGPNAYAQAMRDGNTQRIESTSFQYLVASQQVTARGDDQRPLTIISTEAGTITGGELIVNIAQGTATILGPGSLTHPDEDGNPLTLTWTERVDLDLFLKTPDPDDDESNTNDRQRSGQTQITGIRTAIFLGGVTANHPDFDLVADQLAIDFMEPDEEAGIKNDPTHIQATGDVTVRAQGDAPDEQFAISTQSLAITLDLDTDGEVYAKSMRALAEVRVDRPGSWLTCHRVDVAFAPPSEAELAQAEETDLAETNTDDEGEGDSAAINGRYAQVRLITAVGDVRAEIQEQGHTIHLFADHLLADVEADRLTLYATEEGGSAEVIDVQDDRLLRGRHIVMDDQAQVVRVEGPGLLRARMEDEENPGNPQANMTIDWQRAMRINSASGKAEFHGSVEATTRRTADTSDMTCDDLEIWFTLDEEDDENSDGQAEIALASEVNAQDEATEVTDTMDTTGRNVRLAIATGHVEFVAATRTAEQPDQPSSRMTITGPKLTFTNTPVDEQGNPLPQPIETVVVEGQGTMLIEDYTPEDEEAQSEEDQDGAFAFSGKGQTAFLWHDRMELDARANSARFEGDTVMVHDPTPQQRDNGDFVRLDCQLLIADMHDTGGLGVWMSDEAPAPEISVITATGPLRIRRDGQNISGDYLYYDGATQRVDIWADDNHDVLIQEDDSPAPIRCARVVWDLAQNRIETRSIRGVTPAQRN